MKIVFLMGGHSISQSNEDYPLCFAEINGELVLEKHIQYCLELKPSELIFCVRAEDIKRYCIDEVIKRLDSEANIVTINTQTRGAVCTALLGIEYINNDEELIVMAVDDFIEGGGVSIIKEFREKNHAAGIVYFSSVHPRYSFAKINNGEVVEVAEKHPISKNALVSFYYFQKGLDFVRCAMEVIRKDSPVKDAFYISQTLNEMILQQKTVGAYKIDNSKFHPLKTKIQLAQYITYLKEMRDSK